jgi:hypothetical protein
MTSQPKHVPTYCWDSTVFIAWLAGFTALMRDTSFPWTPIPLLTG